MKDDVVLVVLMVLLAIWIVAGVWVVNSDTDHSRMIYIVVNVFIIIVGYNVAWASINPTSKNKVKVKKMDKYHVHLVENFKVAGRCFVLAIFHILHGLFPCRLTEHGYWGI